MTNSPISPMHPLHRRHLLPVLSALLLMTAPARAGLGDGITTGRLTLRPYVEGSVNYDSNVLRTNVPPDEVALAAAEADPDAAPLEPVFKEDSDTYYELRGGTSFIWRDEQTLVSGSLWAFLRRYDNLDIEDEEGFGERVALARGDRETLSWQLFESYERRFDLTLEDPAADGLDPSLQPPTPPTDTGAIDLGEELLRTRSRRDVLGAGANAGRRLTEKLELDLGYAYNQTEYDDADLFGQSQQTGTASLGRQLTFKTSSFFTGAYGLEDNDNYQDAVPYYQVLAGLRSRSSEKLFYNLGIGYQSYETAELRPRELEDGTLVYSDGSRLLPDGTLLPPEPRLNPVTGEVIEEPTRDGRQTGLAYDAGIGWRPSTKLAFNLAARNSYDSTSAGDQREVNLLQLSATYNPSSAIVLSMRAGYRDEKSVDETILVDDEGVESRFNETREIFTAGGRIGYRPQGKWYEFYVDGTYEDIASNLDSQSYDRLRAGAGIRATY